ncbi:MAG: response regulator [Nanoarchaeota archaeon]|nr:response regulator [Nanoarchaeota archaeon]
MKRILIVDDMREVYEEIVATSREGDVLDYARNPPEAIRMMDEDRNYNRVVTDYHLGENYPNGGIKVVRAATERGLKCILMSTKNHQKEAIEAGANCFVFKRELLQGSLNE